MPVKTYSIRVGAVRFRAKHGVSRSERQLFQDFLVDAELELPIALLPQKDSVSSAVDYDRIASLIVEEGTALSCRLLETVAQRVIARLLKDTEATKVSVSVSKSNPPTASSVERATVTLTATR